MMTENPEAPEKKVMGQDVGEKLGKITQKFAQSPSFNAFERILASYLVQAITADPLEGIVYVCRSALSLTEDQSQSLEVDLQEVSDLYAVAQRLASANKSMDRDEPKYSVNVEALDYGRQVAPWKKLRWYSFRYNAYYPDEIMLKMDSLAPQEQLRQCSYRLSESGYNSMVSDFLIYALPRSQEITRKVSELISPATWQETYATIKGASFKKMEETEK